MTDIEGAVDPLLVRKPPPGLTKDERRDFREDEARRIADLQDQARTGGFRAVRATAPPKGLGRAGRQAWREADRDNRSRRVQAEASGSESDRYVGAMVLMVFIGVVIAMRVLFSDNSDEPTPPPTSPAAVTYQATPTAGE
jgi:hypothetical protein